MNKLTAKDVDLHSFWEDLAKCDTKRIKRLIDYYLNRQKKRGWADIIPGLCEKRR